jgi:prepilin-type N-terminal cleavage/methylation domain-containing protein
MKRKRGFTLIEFLVVIAIVAIIAAILFPLFAKAHQKSLERQGIRPSPNMPAVVQLAPRIDMELVGYANTDNPACHIKIERTKVDGGWLYFTYYVNKNGQRISHEQLVTAMPQIEQPQPERNWR